MTKQVLDVHQMQHLQELGLELKDTMLYWIKPLDAVIGIVVGLENDWQLDFIDDKKKKYLKYIPAYTLQDVLDALPKVIDNKYKLCIEQTGGGTLWCVYYYASDTTELNQCSDESLIDAAYRLLIWVIENGYISKLPANKNSK